MRLRPSRTQLENLPVPVQSVAFQTKKTRVVGLLIPRGKCILHATLFSASYSRSTNHTLVMHTVYLPISEFGSKSRMRLTRSLSSSRNLQTDLIDMPDRTRIKRGSRRRGECGTKVTYSERIRLTQCLICCFCSAGLFPVLPNLRI